MNGAEYVDITQYTTMITSIVKLIQYIIAAALIIYLILKAASELSKIRR
ncbi:MAG: hypothetical protein OH319_02210 [Candidatus Parvarchaeota archaeon]|nr:hypothetical protein [Candidatus Jingweiarchaeum tengchongense]MCW1298182.1 hypothetical protein [Candidatus Jingweiarchaeum tengchongense]MCW1299980.1 hypothetical protein [Candidatus Jingweiarchaeum tengchongense]MCW1305030.1 hypothetical protein [Candidatus Jingweiarchaeum tengchongense]MCW1305471.1 hypothetical protein [Candidatus Jingweiarchaeum tengchongense]